MNKKTSIAIVCGLLLIGCGTKSKNNVELDIEPKKTEIKTAPTIVDNLIEEKSAVISNIPEHILATKESSTWNTDEVNFNFQINEHLFMEDKLQAEYYVKYNKYNPSNLREYEALLKNKIEQDLIAEIWLKNETSIIDYDGFSDPIFDSIHNHFQKRITKNFNSKINNHRSSKLKVLSQNYNNTLQAEKIGLYPLFKFPLEFETLVLKEGFFHSISPMYLLTYGSPIGFSQYMSNKYSILDLDNKKIPLTDLNKMNIEKLSFSIKSCLKTSNLEEQDILHKLDFSHKLLSAFNYYKIDEKLKLKYSKEEYSKIISNEETYSKALNSEFIKHYHHEVSFTKTNEPLPCKEVFEQYGKIANKIKFSSK